MVLKNIDIAFFRVDDIKAGKIEFDENMKSKAYIESYLDKYNRPVVYVNSAKWN